MYVYNQEMDDLPVAAIHTQEPTTRKRATNNIVFDVTEKLAIAKLLSKLFFLTDIFSFDNIPFPKKITIYSSSSR